jgi:iron complex outermembrane receptor protein
MDEERVGAFVGHNYDMDWLFVSPRLGFTYAVNESVSLFTNFAISSRPPIVATIYDGTNPNVQPLMEITSVNSDSTAYTFGDPLIEAERVYDFELGGEYRGERLTASANLFWMDFHDEILPYGTYNPFTGLRAAVNADRTLHAGIELSAAWQLADKLKVDGNFSYNYNRVKDFTIDLDGYQVDFADKKIPGFPDYLGSLVIDGKLGNWRVTPRVKLAGRRYMELENIEHLSLEPFVVASLSLGYTFDSFLQIGRLTISGRVDNLGDKKYETYGYGWVYAYDDGSGNTIVDGGAEYYVAPERSFYGQLQLEMF